MLLPSWVRTPDQCLRSPAASRPSALARRRSLVRILRNGQVRPPMESFPGPVHGRKAAAPPPSAGYRALRVRTATCRRCGRHPATPRKAGPRRMPRRKARSRLRRYIRSVRPGIARRRRSPLAARNFLIASSGSSATVCAIAIALGPWIATSAVSALMSRKSARPRLSSISRSRSASILAALTHNM